MFFLCNDGDVVLECNIVDDSLNFNVVDIVWNIIVVECWCYLKMQGFEHSVYEKLDFGNVD